MSEKTPSNADEPKSMSEMLQIAQDSSVTSEPEVVAELLIGGTEGSVPPAQSSLRDKLFGPNNIKISNVSEGETSDNDNVPDSAEMREHVALSQENKESIEEQELRVEIFESLDNLMETTSQIEKLADDPDLTPTLKERLLDQLDVIGEDMRSNLQLDAIKHVIAPLAMSAPVYSIGSGLGWAAEGGIIGSSAPFAVAALALYAGWRAIGVLKRSFQEKAEVAEAKALLEMGTVDAVRETLQYMEDMGSESYLDIGRSHKDASVNGEENDAIMSAKEADQLYSEFFGPSEREPSSWASEAERKEYQSYQEAKKIDPNLTPDAYSKRLSEALRSRNWKDLSK